MWNHFLGFIALPDGATTSQTTKIIQGSALCSEEDVRNTEEIGCSIGSCDK